MRRPDDSSLTKAQYAAVRREAQRLLQAAGAVGCFPTPIDDVMAAARVQVVDDDVLNPGFIEQVRRKAGAAGGALKRALSKVLGLFDARERLVFIDRGVHAAKKVFLRLHETAHGFLGWHRDLYAVVEDCDMSLSEEAADLFEREANVFASEVLFQLDSFASEANDLPFGLQAPLKLARRYGASAYASIRRYVSTHHRPCAVLVLDPPVAVSGDGFRCNVRRFIPSPRFIELVGPLAWGEYITPDDSIGRMIPVGGRRMSRPRRLEVNDARGDRRGVVAEAFTQGLQVFLLLLADDNPVPLIVSVQASTGST
jgi:hypothetical protein